MGLDFKRKSLKYLTAVEGKYVGYSFTFDEISCNMDLNNKAIETTLIYISGYNNPEALDELSAEALDELMSISTSAHLYFGDYEENKQN